jgi:hypothetical protein
MVIVKATKKSEAGIMPGEKLLAEVGTFNEEVGAIANRTLVCRGHSASGSLNYLPIVVRAVRSHGQPWRRRHRALFQDAIIARACEAST